MELAGSQHDKVLKPRILRRGLIHFLIQIDPRYSAVLSETG